jgi:polyisoprenoid-binding protein YceI
MRTARHRTRYIWHIGWCLAAWPVPSGAQAASASSEATLSSGTLGFSARATVGDFTGTTSTISGAFHGDVASARGWVQSPVATLVTHNDHRDRDLRASLDAEAYPTMRFDLDSTTVVSTAHGRGDSVCVVLHGTLAIHGVSRGIAVPASIAHVGDTTAVRASFPLDLEDYRIGGLKKMFGLLRMDPKILVHVDLRFLSASAVNTDGSRR